MPLAAAPVLTGRRGPRAIRESLPGARESACQPIWLPEKIMQNYLLKGFSFPTFKRLTGILRGRTREIQMEVTSFHPGRLFLVRHFFTGLHKIVR